MSFECFRSMALPFAVSFDPRMAPILFMVPYTAEGLWGYWALSFASRKAGMGEFYYFFPIPRNVVRFRASNRSQPPSGLTVITSSVQRFPAAKYSQDLQACSSPW